MEDYKQNFIDFLMKTGALKVEGQFTLKSGRTSPYFVNIGDFNDGQSTSELGRAYAEAIRHTGMEFDLVYGIPEKGVALAIATSLGLAAIGMDKPWFFTRKVPKDHGEVSGLSPAERIKALVVGRAPQNGQRIVQLDDVFTAGNAKYEARDTLNSLGNFELPLLAIAVDRQEIASNGTSAIAKYESDTRTQVVSIVNARDILDYLRERKGENPLPYGQALEKMERYLRVYGTENIKKTLPPSLEQRIIERDRSVIPACDVSLETFERLVQETGDMPEIGAYKIPATAGRKGWETWIATARKHTQKPLIYDHQKAGTDIHDPTPKEMVTHLKEAGFDAAIIFPLSGSESERAWIYQSMDKGLKLIVGGWMTHPAYTTKEGGFITEEGALEMFRIAASTGINHFVVPGNKPEVIKKIKEVVETEGVTPIFYAPGFVAQRGKISDAAKESGKSWHAIVGRGIYESQDFRKAALEHTSELSAAVTAVP